jgi:teichuronic acid exporter
MKNNSIQGVLWLFLSKFFPPIISFSVFTYSARILEPEDFGLVALALSIITLLSCLMPSGWRAAIIKYQLDDKNAISSIFWFNFFISSFLSFLIIIYALLSLHFELQGKIFNFALIIFSLNLIFDGLFQTLNTVLLKQQQYSKVALRTVITSIVSAVIISVLLYFDFGIWALIWVQPILSLSNFLAVYLPTRQYIGFQFSLKQVLTYNGFSIYATLTESLNVVLNHYESIAIGGILGYKELGLYNMAKRLSGIINDIFINTMNEISFPMLASKQEKMDEFRIGFLNSVYFSVALLFPCFSFLFVVSDDLFMLLFSEKWLGASIVFKAFCISYCLIILGIPQRNVVNLTNHAKWWFKLQFKLSLVILPLITLSAYWGLNYLLLVFILGKLINVLLSMKKCCTLLSMNISEYLISFSLPVAGCIVAAILTSFLSSYISVVREGASSALLHIVTMMFVFFPVYIALLISFDYRKIIFLGLLLFPNNHHLIKLAQRFNI